MKTYGIIGIALFLSPFMLQAQEEYPNFDKTYWVNEQALAEAKMLRGAGLGILGLVSVWPSVMMIIRAEEDPQKYGALSAMFALSTVSAALHGFGSVGFGKQQRTASETFVGDYDGDSHPVSKSEERSRYLHDRRKTARKVTVFGSYLTTVSTMLLTNGIVQSVRKGQGTEMNGIRIWPYYVSGGLLLPIGIRSILKGQRKQRDLKALGAETFAQPQVEIIPQYALSRDGNAWYGLSLRCSFHRPF